MKNFEFIIEKPIRNIENFGSLVRCHVHASFPHIVYNIAVKVFDNEGLENIEIVRLKVNGGLKINE